MTILPKKKAAKDKPDSENPEHPHSGGHPHPLPHGHPSHTHNHGHSLSHPHVHGHYHHSTTGDTRLDKAGRGRTSPTRWGPSTSREEKLHSGSTAAFDFDFESHDSSSNHKRRHRSSPHRTVRKHRGGGHIGHSGSGQNSPPGTSCAFEEEDGYNSEDEHAPPAIPEDKELERLFEENLKEKKRLTIKKMGEDGACLFRAIADQIYGDQEMHSTVRKMCLDYMAKNSEFFSSYVTEDFTAYLNRKRMDHCHGNHLEIQAVAEIFNRPVEVYQYSLEPINTFHGQYQTDNPPIRISYHQNIHYNSLVDPYKPTIGVGLGLPGYQPGLADRTLMEKALKKSENHHLEKAMLEDKMRETDWELTQESIEEQVARESYLQWLKDQEAASKQRAPNCSASATCSSSSDPLGGGGSPEARSSRSPRTRSGQNSPQHPSTLDLAVPCSSSSKSPRCSPKQTSMEATAAGASELGAIGGISFGGFSETSSLMDLPAGMFGLEEDEIMAQVMALSQQEYLDSLKQKASSSSSMTTSSFSSSAPTATITTRDLRLDDLPGCSSSSGDCLSHS